MTVTLLPKAFRLTPEEQYDEYVGKLMNRLLGLSSRLFVVVELTRSYNLHFHLIVQFTKKSKNHIGDVYNLFRRQTDFGYINISQVEDESSVIRYMLKDVEETYGSLSRKPIICNHITGINLSNYLDYMSYDWDTFVIE